MKATKTAVKLCLFGALFSACGGPASVSPSGGAGQLSPASRLTFTFQTVDDPSSTTNAVNGINKSAEIVGTIGTGVSSNPYQGYTSSPPYTSFQSIAYKSSQGTVATSLSSNTSDLVVAGYVINPPQLPGIWAFLRINGIWTLLRDRKQGKGNDAVTELQGLGSSETGVGNYTSPTGNTLAVVLNIPREKFNQLNPPGAVNAAATGINSVNDIVGWESTASSTTGFFLQAGVYHSLAYSGAATTEALGLNSQDQVVGFYQTSSGVKHGFLLSDPKGGGGGQVWQSIDEPGGVNGTVITGINDNDDICGYYIDGSGVQHGFVAVPS